MPSYNDNIQPPTARSMREAFGSDSGEELFLPAPHPFYSKPSIINRLLKGIKNAANEALKKRG